MRERGDGGGEGGIVENACVQVHASRCTQTFVRMLRRPIRWLQRRPIQIATCNNWMK